MAGEKVSKRQPGKQYTGTISISIISGCDASRWALRPKQAHTQHFTLGCSSIFVSFTDFLGKIRLPVVLLGDPGGVKLGKLAGITDSGGKAPLSAASHWWSGVISASQFEQLDFTGGPGLGVKTRGAGISTSSWVFEGVNTRGAGGGMPFTQGEHGGGDFSGKVWLLSTSLSPIWMSSRILWAKGDWTDGEFGSGRFFSLLAWSAYKRWTQAEAACRSGPCLGGGREDAAKPALCSTERR